MLVKIKIGLTQLPLDLNEHDQVKVFQVVSLHEAFSAVKGPSAFLWWKLETDTNICVLHTAWNAPFPCQTGAVCVCSHFLKLTIQHLQTLNAVWRPERSHSFLFSFSVLLFLSYLIYIYVYVFSTILQWPKSNAHVINTTSPLNVSFWLFLS